MTENSRIEYKLELTNDLEKEVVAFLNSRTGGVIHLGVDDNGNPVGVENTDSVQLKIKHRLKNNIKPSCMGLFDIAVERIGNKNIIKIIVAGGYEKPYYIARKGMSEKGCFIRVGSAAEPMPVSMIENLFAKRTRNSIGNIVSRRQNLTFEQLKIYYEARGFKLNRNFAINLELLTTDGKYNYVAFLLSDENNVSFKFAKYSSLDRGDLVENEEYGYCSIIKATKSILDKIDLENTTFAEITPKQRIEQKKWNAIAIREAIVNAIVHNDYTREITPKFEIFPDRLEITSYGSLPEGLSQAEFFSGVSNPRNKELMRVFRDLEMVEHLGSGIPRILRAYSKESFLFMDNFLRTTFYVDDVVNQYKERLGERLEERLGERLGENLNKNQQYIIEMISKNPYTTINELSKKIEISTTAIENNLKKLREKGLLKRIGSDKGGYWQIIIKEDDNE
jgi:predicted HTH transcriptional regulator